MSARAFFDTNVLVYLIGLDDRRTAIAEDLVAGGGVVNVQVLNELAAVSRRKLGLTWDEVDDALGAILSLCPSPAPVTTDTHHAGVRIAVRYGYSVYDALIAAAALDADCDTLYSEDLQDGQVIEGRLTVRNPFSQ